MGNGNGENNKLNEWIIKALIGIIISATSIGGVFGAQQLGFGGAMAADSAVTQTIKDDVANLATRTAVTETEVIAIKKDVAEAKVIAKETTDTLQALKEFLIEMKPTMTNINETQKELKIEIREMKRQRGAIGSRGTRPAR